MITTQADGYGVFVVVNAGGHQDNEITRVRAVFVDGDDVPMPDKWHMAPAFFVQRSDVRWHAYWRVDDLPVTAFKEAQLRLAAYYKSDTSVCNPSRVMRLAGTIHSKDGSPPVVVELWEGLQDVVGSTDAASVLTGLPVIVTKTPEARDTSEDVKLDDPGNVERARTRLKHYVEQRDVAVSGSGGNARTYSLMCEMRDLGLSPTGALDLIEEVWNPHCTPPWSAEELAVLMKHACDYKQNATGCDASAPAAEAFAHVPKEVVPETLPVVIPSDNWAWPAMIRVGKVDKPDPRNIENVRYLMERAGARLRRNEFTGQIDLLGLPRYPEFTDRAVNALLSSAGKARFDISPDLLSRYLGVLADRDTYHPVRDYLRDLSWDGASRLDGWLSTYAGATDTPLHSEFGRVTLLGAVHRVLNPGWKFDYMLVLEGPQNAGKSTLFRVLGGQWFTDQLNLGADAKHTIEASAGFWIVEVPELSGMARKEVERVKAQITTQADTARLAYARQPVTVPRQFVMVGTTNDAQYLRDLTGNRRFLPVTIGNVDLAALERDRDQLWAEAYHRATVDGEAALLRPDVLPAASAAQAARLVVDPWREQIEDLLEGIEAGRILKDDIWGAVGGREAARTQVQANTITATMKALGWEASRHRHPVRKTRVHCYIKNPTYAPWLYLNGHEFKILSEA
ncbi:hypothetical protein C6Y62_11625 [Hyphomicrobium sulfonivorans]|nr:hypothetical protein [Hyphomicrobium sulfonivorans]